jgi:hypothetical protein
MRSIYMYSFVILGLNAFCDRYLMDIRQALIDGNYDDIEHIDSVFTWIVNESILNGAKGMIKFVPHFQSPDYDDVGKSIYQQLGTTQFYMHDLLDGRGILPIADSPVKTLVSFDKLIIAKCRTIHDYYF